MIEQALFFAIGFFVATLGAIVAIPVTSRRAMRLAERRARLQAPLAERQAIAERDALRARDAVEQARLERRLRSAEDFAAALRIDLGRLSARMIALEADRAKDQEHVFDQRAELERLESERRRLEVGLAASQIAIQDVFNQRDRANAAETSAIARRDELEAEASRDRARIAILTARAENLEGRVEDLSRSAKTAAEKSEALRARLSESLAVLTERARALEERLREALDQNERISGTIARTEERYEEEQRLREQIQARLSLTEKVLEQTLLENSRQLSILTDREAALEAATAKVAELQARLAVVTADARANENAASTQHQTLATAHAAMEGSLRATRAEREALQRENEALRARLAAPNASAVKSGDDSQLRESIARLGQEVSRLFAAHNSANREEREPRAPFAISRPDAATLAGGEDRHGLPEGQRRRVARSHAPER